MAPAAEQGHSSVWQESRKPAEEQTDVTPTLVSVLGEVTQGCQGHGTQDALGIPVAQPLVPQGTVTARQLPRHMLYPALIHPRAQSSILTRVTWAQPGPCCGKRQLCPCQGHICHH